MRMVDYLADQKWLIVSYTVMMSFITTVILVDPILSVNKSSLWYIIVVASIIFIVYLSVNYYQKKIFYQELLISTKHEDVIHYPKPLTNEWDIYLQLLKKQQENSLDQIETINREKKEWLEYLTTWFHEIKTPISVSRMIFEVEEHSESLAEEMDKIEHYLEQVLYYSKLSEFHKDYLIQEVDLERVMKNVLKSNAKTFLSKKIKLNLKLSGFTVLSDKKGIQFIINQILINSLKYTDQEGEIEIRIDEKNRTITIRDNGIGIDAEDLPRILEKGFTGKNGRQHQKSTGMGLYLAKKMAEKLGHVLFYSSKRGDHTEATLYFPKEEEILIRKR